MSTRRRQSRDWLDALGVCAGYWFADRVRFAGFAALLAVAVLAELSVPVAIGHLVGEVSVVGENANAAAGAWLYLGLASLAMLTLAIARFGADASWNRLDTDCMRRIQLDIYSRVQRFSADWHANTFAGATVHKISRARWAIDTIGTVILLRLAPSFLLILGIGVLLTLRMPLAGLLFFAMAALYLAASVWLSARWVRPANIAAADADAALTGQVADGVSNNATVRAFGAELREDDRLAAKAIDWMTVAVRSFNRGAAMAGLQQAMWTALQGVTVASLIFAATQGEATPGDVAFAIAACLQLGGHLRSVGGDIRMLQRGFAEFHDAVMFLRAPMQVADAPDACPITARRGEIVFDRITFAYADNPPIYKDFSLRIAPGERIGLVGQSGSGKSTFAKLIQRLYDVDAGAIRIDGVDISKAAQIDLRRQIALVPQDPALFHRSLAENIAYGRPDATPEQIRNAAMRARAAEFIERLPLGYDTLVGERGVKLSGGERQRVAIARAFLADAPILILDEATSSLDTLTEQDIQAAIEELMANRTTIIIAHRLSTVRRVDRILVFVGGAVAEQGRHADLLARPGGIYRRLHTLQVDRDDDRGELQEKVS
jgi:ATP-binding cassette, subfamily B, bacterial